MNCTFQLTPCQPEEITTLNSKPITKHVKDVLVDQLFCALSFFLRKNCPPHTKGASSHHRMTLRLLQQIPIRSSKQIRKRSPPLCLRPILFELTFSNKSYQFARACMGRPKGHWVQKSLSKLQTRAKCHRRFRPFYCKQATLARHTTLVSKLHINRLCISKTPRFKSQLQSPWHFYSK